jgi:Asp-tRNA(Asn)/Glu-tRNA(Gln) amidotransferase A subunit family amidase
VIIDMEAVESNQALLADPARRELISDDVRARLAEGYAVTTDQLAAARAAQARWRAAMAAALRDVDLLALPTVPFFPPPLAEARGQHYTSFTNPVNLAGFPALALPAPTAGSLPASIQLVGPPNSEALLLATGSVIESASVGLA